MEQQKDGYVVWDKQEGKFLNFSSKTKAKLFFRKRRTKNNAPEMHIQKAYHQYKLQLLAQKSQEKRFKQKAEEMGIDLTAPKKESFWERTKRKAKSLLGGN